MFKLEYNVHHKILACAAVSWYDAKRRCTKIVEVGTTSFAHDATRSVPQPIRSDWTGRRSLTRAWPSFNTAIFMILQPWVQWHISWNLVSLLKVLIIYLCMYLFMYLFICIFIRFYIELQLT